jgi:hypothetical protein
MACYNSITTMVTWTRFSVFPLAGQCVFEVRTHLRTLEWLHELDVISGNGFSTTAPHSSIEMSLSPASSSNHICHSRMENL